MVLLAQHLVLSEGHITVGIKRQRKLLTPTGWEGKKRDRKGPRFVNPS